MTDLHLTLLTSDAEHKEADGIEISLSLRFVKTDLDLKIMTTIIDIFRMTATID